mgnify:CR=1 FL=1
MCRAIFVVSVVPRSWLFSSRLALVVALVVAVVVPDLVDWQTTQVSFFRLNSSTFCFAALLHVDRHRWTS